MATTNHLDPLRRRPSLAFPCPQALGRWAPGFTALLLACAVATPARANDRANEQANDRAERWALAKEKTRQARAHEAAGKPMKALAATAEGLAVVPNNRNLLQLRARLLSSRHDYDGALAAYRALLEARPWLSPGDRRKVNKIIRDLRKARSTFLEIAVENGAADHFYLDDPAMGAVCERASRCKKSILPRHTYWVIVERKGYQTFSKRVRVRPNKTTHLAITLTESPSTVLVEVTPEDAQVRIDGQLIGTGNQTAENIAAGEHTIHISRPGFVAHEQTVTARLGQPIAVRAALDELVPVIVQPPGPVPEVHLDGKPVTLDHGLLQLSGGAHYIDARAQGYIDKRVDIPADRPRGAPIRIDLEPEPEPEPEIPPPRPRWTSLKITAVCAAGGLSLLGYGLGTYFTLDARKTWSRAMADCDGGETPGLACTDAGFAAAKRARDTAARGNIAIAAGTAAGLGLLWAWNLGEPATEHGGMSVQRKLSIAAAATVAGAGLALATRFGLRAREHRSAARELCSQWPECSDPAGYVAGNLARDDTVMATLGLSVAAVAATSAIALWWNAPPGESEHSSIDIAVEPNRNGLGASLIASF